MIRSKSAAAAPFRLRRSLRKAAALWVLALLSASLKGCALKMIGGGESFSTTTSSTVPVGTTRTVECTGLPANAAWNVHTTATQTWTGSSWTPGSLAPTHDFTPSSTACRFICNSGYGWSAAACRVSGTLDTSYGTTGVVTLPESYPISAAFRRISIDSDDRAVIATYPGSGALQDIVIRRYLSDGTLDSAFGSSGVFTFAGSAGSQEDWVNDLFHDAFGRPFAVGMIRSATTGGSYGAFFMRLTTGGILDSSFGGGLGYTVHEGANGDPNGADGGQRIIQDRAGRYVGVGEGTYASTTDYDAVIWRFTESGALDTTFNGTGYAVLKNLLGTNLPERFYAVAEDSQNRLVACGSANRAASDPDILVARYTSTGALDTSFNGTGYVTFNALLGGTTETCFHLLVDSSDRIILAGIARNTQATPNNDIFLLRLQANGSLDTSFGTSGKTVLSNLGGSATSGDQVYDLTFDPFGRILLAGETTNTNPKPLGLLARLTADGALDTSFNSTGYLLHNSNQPTATFSDRFRSLRFDSTGRLLVLLATQTATGPVVLDGKILRYFP